MKLKCPKCEKIYIIPDDKIPNRDARTKCKVCGQVITIKGKFVNKQTYVPKTVTCPKCGANSSNSTECSECGIIFSKYNQTLASNNSKPTSEKDKIENQFDKKSITINKNKYYVDKYGEIKWKELKALAQDDIINSDTQILIGRSSKWVEAGSLPDLFSKNKNSNYNWGRVIIAIGVLGLFISFGMDTSVSTGIGRVNNIGLMNEKQNYIIASSFILLIGVVVTIYFKSLNSVKTGTKVCPKCAERIKQKAAICRFCGHDFA